MKESHSSINDLEDVETFNVQKKAHLLKNRITTNRIPGKRLRIDTEEVAARSSLVKSSNHEQSYDANNPDNVFVSSGR